MNGMASFRTSNRAPSYLWKLPGSRAANHWWSTALKRLSRMQLDIREEIDEIDKKHINLPNE